MFILCVAYGDYLKVLQYCVSVFRMLSDVKNAVLVARWTPSYVFCFEHCDIFKLRVAKRVGTSTLKGKSSKNAQLNEVQHSA